MSLDRAQRRALEREQRKQGGKPVEQVNSRFPEVVPWWLALLVALPVVAVPLYYVHIPPGKLIPNSIEQIIINEFQKYVAELVSLGLLLAVAAALMLIRNLKPRLPGRLVWPVLVYLLGLVLSMTQARDLEVALIIGLQVSLCPVLFFLLAAALRWDRNRVLLVLGLMLSAGVLVSIVGISQKLEVWHYAQQLPHVGAGSLVFFQNLAGEYLILLIPPALAMVFMPIHWGVRICAALFASAYLVHLVMTLARGAWVGLAGGVVFSLICAAWGVYRMRGKRSAEDKPLSPVLSPGRKRSLVIALCLVLTLLVGGTAWIATGGKGSDSPYIQELLSINLENTTGRLQIWTDSMGLLKESWMLGVGSGHYKTEILPYLEASPEVSYLFEWNEKTGKIMYPFRPHNDYLQNWIELGLLGTVGMLWLFIVVVRLATRGIADAVADGDRFRSLLILGCFAAFSAWAVSMLFEFPYRMPASMLPGWLTAGLAVSFSLREQEVAWDKFRPGLRLLTGGLTAVLVVACFYVAHIQFWSDLYEKQSLAAWNNRNPVVGYKLIQTGYDYAPWKASIGATKSRMEMGLSRHREALDTSRELLQRQPFLLPALWLQGTSARMLGEAEESRAAFAKIVELYPLLPEAEKYKRFSRQ